MTNTPAAVTTWVKVLALELMPLPWRLSSVRVEPWPKRASRSFLARLATSLAPLLPAQTSSVGAGRVASLGSQLS